jgi:uncharacterized membrane protein YsdA (DUF1294 family)
MWGNKMIFAIVYLIIINLYAIFIMYSDKKKSQKGYWRIPEDKLFIVALLFGSPGILAGMRLFHHKTRHWKFVYGIPLILILQIFLVYELLRFFF